MFSAGVHPAMKANWDFINHIFQNTDLDYNWHKNATVEIKQVLLVQHWAANFTPVAQTVLFHVILSPEQK